MAYGWQEMGRVHPSTPSGYVAGQWEPEKLEPIPEDMTNNLRLEPYADAVERICRERFDFIFPQLEATYADDYDTFKTLSNQGRIASIKAVREWGDKLKQNYIGLAEAKQDVDPVWDSLLLSHSMPPRLSASSLTPATISSPGILTAGVKKAAEDMRKKLSNTFKSI